MKRVHSMSLNWCHKRIWLLKRSWEGVYFTCRRHVLFVGRECLEALKNGYTFCDTFATKRLGLCPFAFSWGDFMLVLTEYSWSHVTKGQIIKYHIVSILFTIKWSRVAGWLCRGRQTRLYKLVFVSLSIRAPWAKPSTQLPQGVQSPKLERLLVNRSSSTNPATLKSLKLSSTMLERKKVTHDPESSSLLLVFPVK